MLRLASRIRQPSVSLARANHLSGQLCRQEWKGAEKCFYATQTTTQAPAEPFRKSLKAAAKQRRVQEEDVSDRGLSEELLNCWELTVGIEIHAQLNVDCKLFSNARSATEENANSLAAVFDLSLPGSQPVFQAPVLIPALRAALALDCTIQAESSFDRKHYFYQDQPAGYQITQYYSPFARAGKLTLFSHDGIDPADGESIEVGIKQIQLEQDTAKSVQQPPDTVLLDFNRVGHPLIEIISLPQIHHPKSAAAYVRKVSQMLLSVNAVTTGMELGGLRADVNVSVRRKGDASGSHSYSGVSGLGQRTEIKNLSSFKAVEDAIIAERNRQITLLENGGRVEGETRGWTLGSTETVKLRGKEGEVDYRYMPDPDIAPLLISEDLENHLRFSLPVLPDAQLDALTRSYGVSAKDAKTLIVLENGIRLQYFQETLVSLQRFVDLADSVAGKLVANWVLHELGGLFSIAEQDFDPNRVSTHDLSQIIALLHRKTITGKNAKKLLSIVFAGDNRDIQQIVEEDNLALQQMTPEQYRKAAQQMIDENVDMAEKIRQGQRGKIQWFVGQMMRQSQGTMDAESARIAIESVLAETVSSKD